MLSLGQQSLAENKSLKEDIRDTDYLCKFWKDNDKPQVWKGFCPTQLNVLVPARPYPPRTETMAPRHLLLIEALGAIQQRCDSPAGSQRGTEMMLRDRRMRGFPVLSWCGLNGPSVLFRSQEGVWGSLAVSYLHKFLLAEVVNLKYQTGCGEQWNWALQTLAFHTTLHRQCKWQQDPYGSGTQKSWAEICCTRRLLCLSNLFKTNLFVSAPVNHKLNSVLHVWSPLKKSISS